METRLAVEGDFDLIAGGLDLRAVNAGDGFVCIDDQDAFVQRRDGRT